MSFRKSFISFVWIGAVFAAADVCAQSHTINGPTLGFATDDSGGVISPIVGIPGASLLGASLDFGAGIYGAVISPKQDYALAVRSDNGQVVVASLALAASLISPIDGPRIYARPDRYGLALAASLISPIDGLYPNPDLIAISPGGTAAAMYNSSYNAIQILVGMPQSPQIAAKFDVSQIPGQAAALAVSDDGSAAMAKFVDAGGPGAWVMSATALARLPIDQPAAMAFFANRRDAIVSDDATQSAVLVIDAAGAATQVPLISGGDGTVSFSSIAASDDGTRVFLADTASGNISIVDVQTRTAAVLPCQCQPQGLYRLKNSIFRLMNASADAMMVLDASGSAPRIVIVPPNASVTRSTAQ